MQISVHTNKYVSNYEVSRYAVTNSNTKPQLIKLRIPFKLVHVYLNVFPNTSHPVRLNVTQTPEMESNTQLIQDFTVQHFAEYFHASLHRVIYLLKIQ